MVTIKTINEISGNIFRKFIQGITNINSDIIIKKCDNENKINFTLYTNKEHDFTGNNLEGELTIGLGDDGLILTITLKPNKSCKTSIIKEIFIDNNKFVDLIYLYKILDDLYSSWIIDNTSHRNTVIPYSIENNKVNHKYRNDVIYYNIISHILDVNYIKTIAIVGLSFDNSIVMSINGRYYAIIFTDLSMYLNVKENECSYSFKYLGEALRVIDGIEKSKTSNLN